MIWNLHNPKWPNQFNFIKSVQATGYQVTIIDKGGKKEEDAWGLNYNKLEGVRELSVTRDKHDREMPWGLSFVQADKILVEVFFVLFERGLSGGQSGG